MEPRRIIRAGAALIAAGAVALATAAPAEAPLKKVKIGVFGTVCEAPLFIAHEKGFFRQQGLDTELVNGNYTTLLDALATGKIHATDGLLLQWFKPIEQGINVKFTAGIHTGCLQIVVPGTSNVRAIRDLKGKTIGVNAIGGGGMNLGTRVLANAGVDYKTGVTWKVFPNSELPLALKKGEVDAIIIGDPFAEIAIQTLNGRSILNSASQAPFEHEYCCLVVLNGDLVKNDPTTAAAITQAILNAARWVKANPKEAARIAVEKKYVPGDAELNARILATYDYEPSVDGGERALLAAGPELKKTGVLDPSTDVVALVKASFVRLKGVK